MKEIPYAGLLTPSMPCDDGNLVMHTSDVVVLTVLAGQNTTGC